MSTDRITRWNLTQLTPYEQIQWRRERRAEAAEMQAKTTALANSFASVNISYVQEQGNLYSRIAMTRMSKTA